MGHDLMGIHFWYTLPIHISKGANNCGQRALEKKKS